MRFLFWLRRSTLAQAIAALTESYTDLHNRARTEKNAEHAADLRRDAESQADARKEIRDAMHQNPYEEQERGQMSQDLVIKRVKVLLAAALDPCFYESLPAADQDMVEQVSVKDLTERTDDDVRFLVTKLFEVVHRP